jgi:competence protein ComGC
MIVIAIIAILASILLPSFVRARAMAQLTGCKSNLKSVATALEAYAVDHVHYPTNIALLTPNYMKSFPFCPAASSDTYSGSYLPLVEPDSFTITCEGTTHAPMGVPNDYPMWDSSRGLIER